MSHTLSRTLMRFVLVAICSIFLFATTMLSVNASSIPHLHNPHPLKKIYGSKLGPHVTYNYDASLQTFCDPGWNSTLDYGNYEESYAATNGSHICAKATWDFGGAEYYYCTIKVWVPSNYADEPNLGFGVYQYNTRIAVPHIDEGNYGDVWVSLGSSFDGYTSVSVSNNTGDFGYYVGIGASNHSLNIIC
jgi:hypothetical protein